MKSINSNAHSLSKKLNKAAGQLSSVTHEVIADRMVKEKTGELVIATLSAAARSFETKVLVKNAGKKSTNTGKINTNP